MSAATTISAPSSRQRSQISKQITLAIAAGLVLALALAAFGIYWSTKRSDEISVERQVRIAEHAIDVSVDALALQQQLVAFWDLPAKELAKPRPALDFLHFNIGLWLYDVFGHDEVIILDGSDRPVQSVKEGRIVPNARFVALRPDLASLIDSVRGRVRGPNGRHDRNPGQPLPKGSTVKTAARSIHDSHLLLVDGRPAVASVMLIQSATPGYVKVRSRPILISVRYLDGNFLTDLSKSNLMESPRFSPLSYPRRGEQPLLLKTEWGEALGYLIWRPERPGSQILGTLVPLNALAMIVLGIFMTLLARRLRFTMTELTAVEAQAAHLAFHDSLTGLPNRALLNSRLEEAIAKSRRGHPLSLILIDLDHFKQVNDTLGHLAGDQLIREFGARLAGLVRRYDTVARLGGDEFAVVLVDSWSDTEVRALCASILDIFEQPFTLLETAVFASASIGAAHAGGAAPDGVELMRRADVALYRAKAEGRNCTRFFASDMDVKTRQRALLEAELRQAIDEGQFAVWYQAEMTRDGRLAGFEALLRWHHPVHGVVDPDRIIPIAEETGLIGPIGDWVLREAAATAARWPGIFIAVNLSPVQFRSEAFADRLIAIFGDAGADPRSIELEVTEHILLDDHREVRKTLSHLRSAGFRIALDDFGTGYSSLSYLQQFRVDKIKIDRSFVGDIDRSAESRAIVGALVTLGHALGLTVTAEGVETEAQADILRASGCDELQGYLYSRPQPGAALAGAFGPRTIGFPLERPTRILQALSDIPTVLCA